MKKELHNRFSILILVCGLAVILLSIPAVDAQTQLRDPLGLNVQTPQAAVTVIIGNVIKTFLSIIGSITLVVMMYGGMLWLTSAGNSERISKGKNVMVWGFIGVVFIFGSYALVNQILKAVPPGGGIEEETAQQPADDSACTGQGGQCFSITECQGFTETTAGESLSECLEKNKPGGTTVRQGLCSGPSHRVCVFAGKAATKPSPAEACAGKAFQAICSLDENHYGVCDRDRVCSPTADGLTPCQVILGDFTTASCMRDIPQGAGPSDCNTDPKICGPGLVCCRLP